MIMHTAMALHAAFAARHTVRHVIEAIVFVPVIVGALMFGGGVFAGYRFAVRRARRTSK